MKVSSVSVLFLSLFFLSSGARASLIYEFSFNNVISSNYFDTGPGVVRGFIYGLSEGTGAASRVEVISSPSDFGLGVYTQSPGMFSNQWTVLSGEITDFAFISLGLESVFPEVTDSSLFFDSSPGRVSGVGYRAGLKNSSLTVATDSTDLLDNDAALQFHLVNRVPIPSTLMLVLLALVTKLVSIKSVRGPGPEKY